MLKSLGSCGPHPSTIDPPHGNADVAARNGEITCNRRFEEHLASHDPNVVSGGSRKGDAPAGAKDRTGAVTATAPD